MEIKPVNNEIENNIDILINSKIKDWPFNANDWLVQYIFNDSELITEILTIKNYKLSRLPALILNLYNKIENIRQQMESDDVMFQKKKNYLLKAEKSGDQSIQISLDGEYSLKKSVSLYKIFELIGWFSRLRNEQNIFKYCIIEKQKLIEKIVPIVDLSVRKVIGAKVVSIKNDNFEDAVSNAWVSIINFMPKIDPSRVMFSVFVSIANKSSYFYMAKQYKHSYNTIQMSILEDKMNQTNDIDGEFFISSVANKNENISCFTTEDNILEKIDFENDIEDISSLYKITDLNIEDILYENTNTESSVYSSLINSDRSNSIEQKILSYSFTILSGKIRKLCYKKIYAEFFIDLIDQKIPKNVIEKYANLFLNVIDFKDISKISVNNTEVNDNIIKMLKSWIKSKQETKMAEPITKINKESKKIEREQQVLEFLKNNTNALEELIRFRKDCLIFKFDNSLSEE